VPAARFNAFPPMPTDSLRRRQKTTLLLLGTSLLLAGLAMLFFLRRVPLPLRIVGGATDVVAGAVVLLLVRQKFSGQPPA
jgi:hypothetical protein